MVDLPQEVDHEDWSNPFLEESLVGVQRISQLQYPLHVGAPIAKQDFKEADIIYQYSYKALEGLQWVKLCSRGVLLDVRRGFKRCFVEVAVFRKVTVICIRHAPRCCKRCDAVGAPVKRQIIIGGEI